MRLIDADALMGRFAEMQKMGKTDGTEYACNFMSAGQEPSAEWYTVEDAVDNAPTVDAVPVVRCQECAKSTDSPVGYQCWANWPEIRSTTPDDYCSKGERKGEVSTT